MQRTLCIITFACLFLAQPTYAGWFSPDNYWECLLDNMQDVQSDTIAQEGIDVCKDDYPIHERIFIKKKSSWFRPHTASACVIKHGKNIKSELAAKHIQAACYKLYPEDHSRGQ